MTYSAITSKQRVEMAVSRAHCIQPDTPIENVLAIYEEVTGKEFL